MNMKAARFPDHEHSHKHTGSYSQSITTNEPHDTENTPLFDLIEDGSFYLSKECSL